MSVSVVPESVSPSLLSVRGTAVSVAVKLQFWSTVAEKTEVEVVASDADGINAKASAGSAVAAMRLKIIEGGLALPNSEQLRRI